MKAIEGRRGLCVGDVGKPPATVSLAEITFLCSSLPATVQRANVSRDPDGLLGTKRLHDYKEGEFYPSIRLVSF